MTWHLPFWIKDCTIAGSTSGHFPHNQQEGEPLKQGLEKYWGEKEGFSLIHAENILSQKQNPLVISSSLTESRDKNIQSPLWPQRQVYPRKPHWSHWGYQVPKDKRVCKHLQSLALWDQDSTSRIGVEEPFPPLLWVSSLSGLEMKGWGAAIPFKIKVMFRPPERPS